jgi:hypothetical protein
MGFMNFENELELEKYLENEIYEVWKWKWNWKNALKLKSMNFELGIDMSMIWLANDMSWIWPAIIVYQWRHILNQWQETEICKF